MGKATAGWLRGKKKRQRLVRVQRQSAVAEATESRRALMKEVFDLRERYYRLDIETKRPIPMILFCPMCKARHVDQGKFATHPHHTHSCQGCGFTWRPAVVDTVGVQFLPGFKDEP